MSEQNQDRKRKRYGVHTADGKTHRDSAGGLLARGKVACCVYHCSVPSETNFTDEMVQGLFPFAWGSNDKCMSSNERPSFDILGYALKFSSSVNGG